MIKHLAGDTRNFVKYINQLKKNLQTLSSALRQEYKNPGYADQAAFSLVMQVVLEKFGGNPNLFDFTPSLEDNPGATQELNLVIGKTRQEIASLCDDLFKIKDRNILGDIYEALHNNGQKKGSGQYYTPDFIVDYILEKTLGEADIVQNPYLNVLDPSCGCGHFLLKVYDLLKGKFSQNLPLLRNFYGNLEHQVTDTSGKSIVVKGTGYWQEENLHYHILKHCLFGADIDSKAVSLTLIALTAKDRFSFAPATNIICCDSLIRPENSNHPDFKFWSRKYNYVVGNPPYVSFGLKRAGKLKNAAAQYLRQNYPNSAEYKISYYALFLERFIELSAPGAKIGVITPDSFLLGRYFSKIRRFILKNCLIDEILLLNQPVFAASVGFPVISIFTKINNETPLTKNRHQLTAKKWFRNTSPVAYTYPQNYFEKQAYFRFRLFFSQIDKNIIDKMDKSPHALSDFTKIKTGMRSLTTQKDIIRNQDQPLSKTCKRGIISSAEVKPFFIDYQGNWLDVDPAKLNPGGWDKTVIENPKILIRQTGNFLTAAIDRDKFYHLNNVHSISMSGEGISLEYLLCIINSKLMNYYYRTVSLEAGRSMAQTDIETLEKLPLVLNREHTEELTVIAKKLNRSMKLQHVLKNKSGLKERLLLSSINRLQTRLNNIIYRLYGLTYGEISHVEGEQI